MHLENSPRKAAARFTGARLALVERHLETLELMGELRLTPAGQYEAPTGARAAV